MHNFLAIGFGILLVICFRISVRDTMKKGCSKLGLAIIIIGTAAVFTGLCGYRGKDFLLPFIACAALLTGVVFFPSSKRE